MDDEYFDDDSYDCGCCKCCGCECDYEDVYIDFEELDFARDFYEYEDYEPYDGEDFPND